MSSETHAFNVAAAMEVGIKAAMLLGKIAFWCDHNAKKDEHFHDGRYWSYASASYFQKEYPYLKLTTIKRVLKKLEEDGYIVTGCYNKLGYDRTTWYSPTDKGLELLSRRVDSLQRETRSKMDRLKSDPVQNGPDPVQNGPRVVQNGPTIPDPVQNGPTIPCLDYLDSSSNHTSDGGQMVLFDGGQAKPSEEDVRKAEIDEIVDYFYEVTKRKRRGNQSAFRKKLNARLNDGNSVEDVKSAIRKKHADVVGTKWESRCMSPSWLFDPSHFEDALNLPEPSQHEKKDGGARNAEYVRYTN